MLTVTADRSWGAELVNVQKISREMDYSFLLGIDASSLQSISAGSDMLRLPFNSRQTVPQDWSLATRDQNQHCTRWASDLGRRIALRARPCWCYSWPAASEIDTSAAAAHAEQQYIHAGLSYQEPVVTVEDKDPSVLWVCESQQLFGRWLYMLSTQPRWAIHRLDVAALVTFYRNLLDTCLPRSMLPANMAFSRRHLPYAYPTIKRKCYNGTPGEGPMKTCQKPQHSCMRNIVSFIRLPGRATFKAVGRGLRHLLHHHSKGWFVRSMDTAHHELKTSYDATLPRPLNGRPYVVCVWCGAKMYTPGACTADAGQAFEVLEVDKVLNTTTKLFERAGLKGGRDTTVTVITHRTHLAHDGGRVMTHNPGRVVFWLSRLAKCTRALLAMRFYVIGNLMLEQVRGIPIGGPISAVLLDITLAQCEYGAEKHLWREVKSRSKLKGAFHLYIAAKRYADDIAMVSRWFCKDCLFALIKSTFDSTVAFDLSTESHTVDDCFTFKFLDF